MTNSHRTHSKAFAVTGATQTFALIGNPVRHSLSPQMHNAMMAASNTDGVYVALEVCPDQAKEVAESIRTLGLSGVNLTVPFKESILPYLDALTPAAQRAGAVNAVALRKGRLEGHNTDGAGFLAALDAEHDFNPTEKRCVLLGAGGAARSIATSLAMAGAHEIHLLNRSLPRAEGAAEALSQLDTRCNLKAGLLNATDFEQIAHSTDLVVNCLAAGAEELVHSMSIEALPDHAIWADINYWMPNPPQLEACRKRGLLVSDGLGMLVYQGVQSFEWFVGKSVPPQHVFDAIANATTALDPKSPKVR